jgi:hypothetical protein
MTKAQEMLERQLTEWFNALPGESIGKNNYDKMIGIVRLAAQADAPGGQPQSPKEPQTLWGMIAAIYGKLDDQDCTYVDREWAKMRGYILPADGTAALTRPDGNSK